MSCWGQNITGQLGDGITATRLTPVRVATLRNAVAFDLGHYHTCACASRERVWFWGKNEQGQRGDGTNSDRSTPVRVRALVRVVQITTGAYHSCARVKTGRAFWWGNNRMGQLGLNYFGGAQSTRQRVAGLSNGEAVALGRNHSCAQVAGGAVYCWGANSYGQLGDGTTAFRRAPVRVTFP